MTDHEQSAIGSEASRVLESPAYREAMDRLQRGIFDLFKKCSPRDQQAQTILVLKIQLAEDFEAILHGLVEGGKMADAALKRNATIDQHRDENMAQSLRRRFTRQ